MCLFFWCDYPEREWWKSRNEASLNALQGDILEMNVASPVNRRIKYAWRVALEMPPQVVLKRNSCGTHKIMLTMANQNRRKQKSRMLTLNWLVVWNIFYFPIYWE